MSLWRAGSKKGVGLDWYLVSSPTERHDALYVVGALDEAMELRGMRYHPIDIETSVIRAHKSVTEW